MKAWQTPGLAIAIVKDGKIVYQKGFGIREKGKPEQIDEHTVFPIASLSKNFLATLLSHLIDQGKLSWEDPVRKYFPDFFVSDEATSQAFTVRDLVTHRSGLPGFCGDTLWELGFSAQEIIKGIERIPAEAPFRSIYAYQNHFFGLAGLLIEKVTQRKIEDLYQELFFTPLNMKDSWAGPEKMIQAPKNIWQRLIGFFSSSPVANHATPHTFISGEVRPIPVPPQLYTFVGSTGVNASIADMATWCLFHLSQTKIQGKPFLSESARQHMQTEHVKMRSLKPDDLQFPANRYTNVGYGMGWFLQDYGSNTQKVHMLSHMGGFSSVRSFICLVPELNMGVVILANLGALRVSMQPEMLRNKFFDLLLTLDDMDWTKTSINRINDIREKRKSARNAMRLQHLSPPEKLSTYVGRYENDLYGPFEITIEKDQLFLNMRHTKLPLKHFNASQFTFDSWCLSPAYSSFDDGFIEFGGEGKHAALSAIHLLHEGKDPVFKRIAS